MTDSLKPHLEEEFIWCRWEPELVSLNQMLENALSYESREEIMKMDHRLVGVLHTDGYSEERYRAIKIILKEVQKLYEPASEHELWEVDQQQATEAILD